MFEIIISLNDQDRHVAHKLTFLDDRYEEVRKKMSLFVKEIEAISTKPLKVELDE